MGSALSSAPAAPEELTAKAVTSFLETFGADATALAVAPGRVEIIGNHTDYNEGYILSAAVDKYVVMVGRVAPTERGSRCRVASQSFPAIVEFDSGLQAESWDKNKQVGDKSWGNYVIGVASELRKLRVKIPGFDAYLVSNVPPGAGVSSSAAVEMATAKLLQKLFPSELGHMDQLALVKVAKAAENNFVGCGCGILDQFSSGMGRADSLVFLDCRTLSYSYVPMNDAKLVLANTHSPHQLVDGKYNEIRRDCFAAKDAIVKASGKNEITHLRDVDIELFEQHQASLSDAERKRGKHIVYENDRVIRSVEACKAGDMTALGEFMTASHASSRDDLGNSCKELDVIQSLALGIEGVLGSRLMGGGFGGSTINLVKSDCVDSFVEELQNKYEAELHIKPTVLVCTAGNGAFAEDL